LRTIRGVGKIIENKFQPFNYKRSQDRNLCFFENGLLYITKASLILDIIISENAIGSKPYFASCRIDT
jgi:N-acylneuraminate cytidylyltransferase